MSLTMMNIDNNKTYFDFLRTPESDSKYSDNVYLQNSIIDYMDLLGKQARTSSTLDENMDHLKSVVEIPTKLGGKNFLERIKPSSSSVMLLAMDYSDDTGLKVLLNTAKEVGGSSLVKEMLKDSQYFYQFCEKGNVLAAKTLIDTAKEVGGNDLVKTNLRSDIQGAWIQRFSPTYKAVKNQHTELLNVLLDAGSEADSSKEYFEALIRFDDDKGTLSKALKNSDLIKTIFSKAHKVGGSAFVCELADKCLKKISDNIKEDVAELLHIAKDPSSEKYKSEIVNFSPATQETNKNTSISKPLPRRRELFTAVYQRKMDYYQFLLSDDISDREVSMVKKEYPEAQDNLLTQLLPIYKKSVLSETNLASTNESNIDQDVINHIENAGKAATLFSDIDQVKQYVDTFEQNNPDSNKTLSKAFSFELPKQGNWSVEKWRGLVLQDTNAAQYLNLAPHIEKYVAEESLMFPENSDDLNSIVGSCHYKRGIENPALAKFVHTYYSKQANDEKFSDALEAASGANNSAPLPDLNSRGLNRPLYKKILPSFQAAQVIEENSGADEFAFKAAVLFVNEEQIGQYLAKNRKNNPDNQQLVHDAFQFNLPEKGKDWTPKKWRALLQQDQRIANHLGSASEIEQFVKDNDGVEFPKNYKDVRSRAADISFKRSKENPAFADLAFEYGLSEKVFNYGLDILQKSAKTRENLPNIFIDGADLGKDTKKYYMTKMETSDPKGLILGHITHCCQSIYKTGHHSAVHGTTSENGGFYVWKEKTKGKITEDDKIVAQSWAWIGKQGEVVFDSFESRGGTRGKLAQPFLEQFAHETIGKHFHAPDKHNLYEVQAVSSVNLGRFGQTPRNLPYPSGKASPTDARLVRGGYRDSRRWSNGNPVEHQYSIPPVDHANQWDKQLPEPSSDNNVEEKAKTYIAQTTQKLKDQYGIDVRTGMEIEFYAVGNDGKPTSSVLDNDAVSQRIRQSNNFSKFERFDHENPYDFKGQYEVSMGVGDPLTIATQAQNMRSYLKENASTMGVQDFNFSAMPFETQEASGVHISVSLWDQQCKPLFADAKGRETTLLKHIAKGMSQVQTATTLMAAPDDDDYRRFGHTRWSPGIIGVGHRGDEAKSLRISNAVNQPYMKASGDPSHMRIENRITSSGANYYTAMAATLAGIEHGIQQSVSVVDDLAAKQSDDIAVDHNKSLRFKTPTPDKYSFYELPRLRYDALKAFEKGKLPSTKTTVKDLFGDELSQAVIQQQKANIVRDIVMKESSEDYPDRKSLPNDNTKQNKRQKTHQPDIESLTYNIDQLRISRIQKTGSPNTKEKGWASTVNSSKRLKIGNEKVFTDEELLAATKIQKLARAKASHLRVQQLKEQKENSELQKGF